MDNIKQDRLIQEIQSQCGLYDYNAPSPTVSLELFFEGNDDPASIGCNIPNSQYPGVEKFYEILKKIREREDVQDVLVRIYGVESDNWPYTDEVYILSSAPKQTIIELTEQLLPSDVYSDAEREDSGTWETTKPKIGPSLSKGMKAYYVFWD